MSDIPADSRPIVLMGDRPTGPLHLGHFCCSLRNRVTLQHGLDTFVLIADAQALSDNADDPGCITRHVIDLALDDLAVGIDPSLTTICVQSALPALCELTQLFLNLVTVARLERNPTIKEEIQARGFGRDIPAGFLCYPVAQAADIAAFRATLVPVGADQAPMIEQTNAIVRRLNRQVGHALLPEARALIPASGRLPGVDGRAKMSKSHGNALALSAADDEIRAAVRRMYTDPDHLRVSDPGRVEGNVVFTYLDAFDPDRDTVAEMKAHYRRGGLGDTVVKQRLETVLLDLLASIRVSRGAWADRPDDIADILRDGTRHARGVTQATLDTVKDALGLYRLAP
ncbi:tryptophan--tRNA ligase [Methylobacterium sp. R2-1]|uniref:tryptophan--tRNA ligase n=1 Tax=Methylobacterium sp. R2-1 TaxID=2587064 RepID=UPI001616D3AE|nr:tryptophan--tRNA ligase [Methylobacterium sp. R2-1]MBB2964273.1 tryptophanyl-tRNA synthetase [Methylobacterium sp. R2-1]